MDDAQIQAAINNLNAGGDGSTAVEVGPNGAPVRRNLFSGMQAKGLLLPVGVAAATYAMTKRPWLSVGIGVLSMMLAKVK